MSTPAPGVGGAPGSLDRRSAWTVLALTTTLLVVLAAWLVPWDWTPTGTLRPPGASEVFTPAELARAEEYAGSVRPLAWSSYAVSLTVVLLVALTETGRRLVRRVQGRRPWWSAVLVTVLLVSLLDRLLTLPFAAVIRRRNLEVGLTRQALGPWLLDQVLSLLVSAVLMSLIALLVVGLARRLPRRWPLAAGVAVAGATFTVSLLYPVVVEPLFNRFTPMAAGGLRTSLLALAERQQVTVQEVLVADASRRTTTLNAYVSGFGGTRRLVVYDTLLASLPPRQVEVVVAHELGHARHRDVVLGTTLAAVAATGGMSALALLLGTGAARRRVGGGGPGDPAVVPVVLAAVAMATFLASPVQNTVSRAIEARADRVALAAVDDPAAFETVQRRFALRSLADPTPPRWSHFWFGSHPTVLQRLGLARAAPEGTR